MLRQQQRRYYNTEDVEDTGEQGPGYFWGGVWWGWLALLFFIGMLLAFVYAFMLPFGLKEDDKLQDSITRIDGSLLNINETLTDGQSGANNTINNLLNLTSGFNDTLYCLRPFLGSCGSGGTMGGTGGFGNPDCVCATLFNDSGIFVNCSGCDPLPPFWPYPLGWTWDNTSFTWLTQFASNHSQGATGATGTDGMDGGTGATGFGATGATGTACWDLNGNGDCDKPSEDPNGDDACNALDCIVTVLGNGTLSVGHGVSVYRNASLVHLGNLSAIGDPIPWDAESFDTDNYHSLIVNSTEIVIPTGLGGLYTVACRITFLHMSPPAKSQGPIIYINGAFAESIFTIDDQPIEQDTYVSKAFLLSEGDSINCRASQDSGANVSYIGGAPRLFLQAILHGNTLGPKGATGASVVGNTGNTGSPGTPGLGYDGITSVSNVTLVLPTTPYTTDFAVNKYGALGIGTRIRLSSADYPDTGMEGFIVDFGLGNSIKLLVDLITPTSAAGLSFVRWNVSVVGEPGQPGGNCSCTTTVFGLGVDLFLGSSEIIVNNFATQAGENADERGSSYVVYGNVTAMRLTVALSGPPDVGRPAVFTVRKNGVNTALSRTLTNPATTATLLLSNLTFTTFDLISLQMTSPTPGGNSDVFVNVLISY